MPVKFLAMTDKTTGLYAIVIFKSDCRKTNAKVITSTHHKRNKQADKAITISRSKHGNKRACKVLLVLILPGRKTGARILSQLLSEPIAIV